MGSTLASLSISFICSSSKNGLSLYVLIITSTSHSSTFLFCSISLFIHISSSSGLKSMKHLYFVRINNWKNCFLYESSFHSLQYNISRLLDLIFCSSSAPMNSTILPQNLYVFDCLCISILQRTHRASIISSKSLWTDFSNDALYFLAIVNIPVLKYLCLSTRPFKSRYKKSCKSEYVLLLLVHHLLIMILAPLFRFFAKTGVTSIFNHSFPISIFSSIRI